MIFDEEKRLFVLKDMKVDEVHAFDLESKSDLRINDIMYSDNIVSKVEFIRHEFSTGPALFIHIFMGNLRVGTIVSSEEDYVLKKNCQRLYYEIRKAEKYDYSEKEINPLQRVQ